MRMRKKKHSAERIEACAELLIKNPLDYYGKSDEIFPENAPMLLEIGCGKGDFAVGLSKKETGHNVIALERVPDVAMFALEKAKATKDERPDNLRFIIGKAEYLCDWFEPSSFDRIYVNFCDPWPKKGYFKRRLTAPSFLEAYTKLLVPGGELHFKTDNEPLFDWSVEQFEAFGLETLFITRDLHSSEMNSVNIETEYERHFSEQGMNIYSAHVRFPASLKEKLEKTENDGSDTEK